MADLKHNVYVDKHVYDEAERIYYEKLAKSPGISKKTSTMCDVISESDQNARKCELRKSVSNTKASTLNVVDDKQSNQTFEERIKQTETAIKNLVKEFQEVRDLVMAFNNRLESVESLISKQSSTKQSTSQSSQQPSISQNDDDADDGVDLFGSDSEEDDEAKQIKERRLAAYAEKKSKKPALVAKSSIILDVKPWDDETNMVEIEEFVRSITMDGLLWGASKLVPLAYGIKKLQISCVVEDDKVSIDLLTEKIESFESHVQSVDIAAFNKV